MDGQWRVLHRIGGMREVNFDVMFEFLVGLGWPTDTVDICVANYGGG